MSVRAFGLLQLVRCLTISDRQPNRKGPEHIALAEIPCESTRFVLKAFGEKEIGLSFPSFRQRAAFGYSSAISRTSPFAKTTLAAPEPMREICFL